MSILRLQLSAERARRVAKLLGNDTARRVMDAVSDDSKSESQLAKELNLPLSTVHYNVQRLAAEGLLSSDEFTYSEKGREVRHYKLASEHVLITTKPVGTTPAIVTGAGLAVALAAFLAYLQVPSSAPAVAETSMVAMDASARSIEATAPAATLAWPLWSLVLAGAAAVLLGILLVQLIQRYRA